jgi:hypothetical protein
MTDRSAKGFVYECDFSGLTGATLTPPPMLELIW